MKIGISSVALIALVASAAHAEVLTPAPPQPAALASVPSPILSPETANGPSTFSLYMQAPLVRGWTDTSGASSGAGVYSQMITDNLTVLTGGSVHYGMEERTLQVSGTGATYSGELNTTKTLLWINAGVTDMGGGEAIEPATNNFGTIGFLNGVVVNNTNNNTGVVTGFMTGISVGGANFNTRAGAVNTYAAVSCQALTGGGSVPAHGSYCIHNLKDPTQEIATVAPIALQTTGTSPPVTACGTTCPTQSVQNSDMSGVVTEGTSATGFTLTFLIMKPIAPPNCSIWPENGAAATAYSGSGWTVTPSQASLVVAHASATSPKFGYLCFNNY